MLVLAAESGDAMKKKLFFVFKKANKDTGEVSGVLTKEEIDQDGEVFDYDSSKKYFQAWNKRFQKNTDGTSKGNVREMHDEIAVGLLKECEYDDEEKQIWIKAKIVDTNCWKKIEARVYTGFSVGGDLIKRYTKDGLPHIIVNPLEASVVDNPAVTSSVLEMSSAGKCVQVTKAAKLLEENEDRGVTTRRYSSELGEFVVKDRKTKRVAGVDLTSDCFAYVGDPNDTSTWKLPIKFPGDDAKTKRHIRNTLARFNQTQGIPANKRSAVLALIRAAAKKHGIDVSSEEKKAMESQIVKAVVLKSFEDGEQAVEMLERLGVKKGMYAVGNLANVLSSISYLRDEAIYERDREGDESELPEGLTEWLDEGVDLLVEMAQEEGEELKQQTGKTAGNSTRGERTMDLEKKKGGGLAAHFKKAAGHHAAIAKALRSGDLHKAADMHDEHAEACAKMALTAADAGEVPGEEKTVVPEVKKSAELVELEKIVAGGTEKAAGNDALSVIAKAVATIAASVEDIKKSTKEQFEDVSGAITAIAEGLVAVGEEPAKTAVVKGVVVDKVDDQKRGEEETKKATGTEGKAVKSTDGRDLSPLLSIIKNHGRPSPSNG